MAALLDPVYIYIIIHLTVTTEVTTLFLGIVVASFPIFKATEIPWPVERHSYLPDPSLPLAHVFTRARIFVKGLGTRLSTPRTSVYSSAAAQHYLLLLPACDKLALSAGSPWPVCAV